MASTEPTASAEPMFYDRDPADALRSKIRWSKRFALLETLFYAALLPLMIKHFILHQDSPTLDAARKVISYFHGMVVVGFTFMAWDLRRLLKWSWAFFLFALLPVGSLFAHARLTRHERSIVRDAQSPSLESTPPPVPASGPRRANS